MPERDGPTVLEPGGPNALAMVLGLLGDEWTLLILQQALLGVTRYARFADALPISNAVLSARLAALTEQGLLERHVYQENPPRAEYLTTPRARSLWTVMLAIWDWERRWVTDRDEELPVMRHEECGALFAPVLTCASCGEAVAARDVAATWGPSGDWARSVPRGSTRRRWDADDPARQAGFFPQTMTVFGNRWASALLGAVFRGLSRFRDLEAALGAPPSVLADRLRAFTAIGVLEPVRTLERADWAEYRLTDKGRAFFPVIAATFQWAQRWYRSPEGPALLQSHRACGREFVPAFTCDQCGGRLTGRAVEVVPAATVDARPHPERV